MDDVDLCLQECRADALQRLPVIRKFHADQLAFDESQAGAFENFSALIRMADQKTHKSTFTRVVNGEGDDPDL